MPHASRSTRRGYTLTELMVVVLIMVIMMALALPAVRRASEDARVREASRQVQAFFTMAKARAAATGRVAGVEFVVQQGVNNSPFSTQMYLCESPNLYGGATSASLAQWNGTRLSFTNGGNDESSYLHPIIQDPQNPAKQVPFQIRFGFRGEWYDARWDGTNYVLLGGSAVAPPSQPLPFQIRKLPQRVGNPSELPAGTVVDLHYSGTGTSTGPSAGHELGAVNTSLQIVFSPNGNVEGIAVDGVVGAPASALFLLVGQSIKVGNRGQDLADPRNDSNLAEGTNLWVSIGRLTGAVATSENVVNASRDSVQADFLTDLRTARQFAINREQMKGK